MGCEKCEKCEKIPPKSQPKPRPQILDDLGVSGPVPAWVDDPTASVSLADVNASLRFYREMKGQADSRG